VELKALNIIKSLVISSTWNETGLNLPGFLGIYPGFWTLMAWDPCGCKRTFWTLAVTLKLKCIPVCGNLNLSYCVQWWYVTLVAKVILLQLTCFPKVVQQQYVGEVGKWTTVLQINSVYCRPDITEIGYCFYRMHWNEKVAFFMDHSVY